MTLMALGRTPETWAAGVELFGIIDWMSMLQYSDAALQQYEKSLLGDPVKDKKVYEATSPIAFIHEAVQVVDLLETCGNTVSAHYYPDEGYGFEKRENQIDTIRRTIEWFAKYLKGQTPKYPSYCHSADHRQTVYATASTVLSSRPSYFCAGVLLFSLVGGTIPFSRM